jgi:hypothetical protein
MIRSSKFSSDLADPVSAYFNDQRMLQTRESAAARGFADLFPIAQPRTKPLKKTMCVARLDGIKATALLLEAFL